MFFVKSFLAMIFLIIFVALKGVFARPNNNKTTSPSETNAGGVVYVKGE